MGMFFLQPALSGHTWTTNVHKVLAQHLKKELTRSLFHMFAECMEASGKVVYPCIAVYGDGSHDRSEVEARSLHLSPH